MDKRYVLKIVNRAVITLGHTHVIAYKHPTLRLRFGAAHRSSHSPRFAQYAAQHTILTFRLDWEETELWESPPFRAQVTFGPDEQGQFELRLLDKDDLSGLQERRT
jgi:hypothetical protein